jgi:hypothetical protein
LLYQPRMVRPLGFALGFALIFGACGRAQRELPTNDDAAVAGRAGAGHDASGSGNGSGTDTGDGARASGGEPSPAGGTSAGSGGIVAAVGGAGAGNESLPDVAGAAGTDDGVTVQPWDPRVPPEVLPLEGDGALTGIWYGGVTLLAPGFYAPPVDHLTLALDDSGLRSFVFQQFSRKLSVTDGVATPPEEDNGRHFPVEVGAVSATEFELRYAASSSAEGVDYVESVQGELRDGALAVTYFVRGALDNFSSIDAVATGLLHRVGSPRAPTAVLSGIWYDEVSLSAPGFAGPPRDQLTLAFDVDGRLKHLSFDVFSVLPLTFGESESEYPLSGARWVKPRDSGWSFDAEVLDASFTPSNFGLELGIRSHDDSTPFTDVTVSVSGALTDVGLEVSYAMLGTLYTSPVDAHAEGTLLP